MDAMCRVAGWVPGGAATPRAVRRHRARCLRCQADEVRMRGLLRDLGSLRSEVFAAPPGLHASVMAGLAPGAVAAPRSSRARAVVAAAAGAAVAAAAVIGGVVLRRQRIAG